MKRRGEVGAPDASPAMWRDLAEVGLLGLCTEAIGGSPLDLAAGMETLGMHLCPGPIVAAVAAGLLLDGETLDAVVSGRARASLTDGQYVPWPSTTDLVIEISEGHAWLVSDLVDLKVEPTISAESWGRGRPVRGDALGDPTKAIALSNLALSAYLLGAARRLIEQGVEHAKGRVQFGQPIGAFQAVAHPLANAWAEVGAARSLAFLVATELAPPERVAETRSWQLRRAATRTALDAAFVVHQVMGAMGFATETGVATASTRIRQWSLLPPTWFATS